MPAWFLCSEHQVRSLWIAFQMALWRDTSGVAIVYGFSWHPLGWLCQGLLMIWTCPMDGFSGIPLGSFLASFSVKHLNSFLPSSKPQPCPHKSNLEVSPTGSRDVLPLLQHLSSTAMVPLILAIPVFLRVLLNNY